MLVLPMSEGWICDYIKNLFIAAMKSFPFVDSEQLIDRVADKLSQSNHRSKSVSLGKRKGSEEPRQVAVEMLEPRILFSGSPAPAPEAPPAEEAPAAQEATSEVAPAAEAAPAAEPA